ncbi:uncharacterized protein LOC124413863 [Diprion similis]|uniref:uncharacterized protein LOC124413863 n=1 Tax=Diprion similis TaxID=362088 RepID=UPI001EF83710|nr:uncharacterized protein LOC124413863 [Diprion similis]
MNEKKLTLMTELHKPARRNYPRRRVDVRGINETWQADLVNMMSYAGQNKGYGYMLTVIDIFSKYAWAVPIKSKSGDDVTKAMESVLTQGPAAILSAYNNTKHRTIRMKPSDVTVANERLVLRQSYEEIRAKPSKPVKFKTGDNVRINKLKNVFEKGYTPNWTTKIFTISQVENTNPVTYKLKDYQGRAIAGGFYEQELLKVEHSDIYLVEKVPQKRGKKLYVKWLGFDNTHNSWTNESDM